jgi:membrane-associated progesterone receptor component
MPRRHTPTLRFTTYTPRTLAKFNGHDGGRILFAIAGIVFDVTGGKGFYGPDGMYWRVAGRDASRSVAKQSFDLEPLTPIDQPLDKLDDLTLRERENMKGWTEHFTNRYIICGRLVDNNAAES